MKVSSYTIASLALDADARCTEGQMRMGAGWTPGDSDGTTRLIMIESVAYYSIVAAE